MTESEKKRAKYTPEGPLVCSDEVQCLASYICSAYTFVKEYEIELQYLKSKVDAGASLITTQMFFEAELYQQFVEDCKARGINAVVIPGIMLLQVCDLMIIVSIFALTYCKTYHGFHRMTEMCKSRVPKSLVARLDAVKVGLRHMP